MGDAAYLPKLIIKIPKITKINKILQSCDLEADEMICSLSEDSFIGKNEIVSNILFK